MKNTYCFILVCLSILAVTKSFPANCDVKNYRYHVTQVYTPYPARILGCINDAGEVTMTLSTSSGVDQACLWRNKKCTLIQGMIAAFGINNQGNCVGIASTSRSQSSPKLVPCQWLNNSLSLLECPNNFTNGGVARAINNKNDVTGWLRTAGASQASIWIGGHIMLLPNLSGGSSLAYALNSGRSIVGEAEVLSRDGDVYHACLWMDGKVLDLGTLGAAASRATGINSGGDIVGYTKSGRQSADSIHEMAFYKLKDQRVKYLPCLDGYKSCRAESINDHRIVVGSAIGNHSGNSSRAVFWLNGAVHDLKSEVVNGKSWELLSAVSINNSNAIVGQGIVNGIPAVYVAMPISNLQRR